MPDKGKVTSLRADLPLWWEMSFEGIVSRFEGEGVVLDEGTETDEGVSQRKLDRSWCADQETIQYSGDMSNHLWRCNDGTKTMAGDGVGFGEGEEVDDRSTPFEVI